MATDVGREVGGRDEADGGVVERVRRRGRWWIVGTLAALVVVVWALPLVVAHSPLRNRVLASVFADVHGTVSAGSASLGWFSPVVLYDVEVRDASGEPLASVPVLTGDTSLRALLMDSTALGHYRLEHPEIHLVLDADKSNAEETLAHWLDGDEQSGLECPGVGLEIVDGTVTIDDTQTRQQWTLEKLNTRFNLARNWSQPLSAEVSAAARSADRTAPVSLELTIDRKPTDGTPATTGKAVVRTESFPVELVEPLLRRLWDGAHLAGYVSSNVTCQWQAGADQPTAALVDGTVSGQWLVVRAPQLSADEVRLERFELPCRLTQQGSLVTIERLSLNCDVGQAELQGPLTLDLSKNPATEGLAAALRERYRLEGHIDLARLAELLPQTLRLKEDTQITAGEVTLDIGRQSDRDGAAWQGQIEMTNVSAVHRGRKITWNKPVTVTLAARDGVDGPVIDRLLWQSTFLELEAAGTLDYMSASAVYNFKELANQLGQFIELDDMDMAGDGWSYLSWQRARDGNFQVDGEFQVRDLSLGTPGRQPWTEDNLIVNTTWTGRSELKEIRRIDTAVVDLESGSDAAHVRLLQPVADMDRSGEWTMEVQGQGQLATWLPRLAPVVGRLEGWDLSGDGHLEGLVSASADKLQLDQTKLVVRQFRVEGASLHVQEPVVQLTCSGQYDRLGQRLTLPTADLTTGALAVRARDLVCATTDRGVAELSGGLTCTGDVARLQAWFLDPAQPVGRQFSGRLRGQLDFTQAGASTTGKLDAQIENLAVLDVDGHEWSEPRVDLAASGHYASDLDVLEVERATLESRSVRCDATGRLSDLVGRRELDLRGKFDYDTEALVDLLRPWLGDGVQVVAGRDARPFSVRATLASAPAAPTAGSRWDERIVARPNEGLTAQAGIGWTGATLYGFQVGPAELRGTLADGLVELAPLDVTVSDGRLTTTPRIRLWPGTAEARGDDQAAATDQAELLLDKGPLLTRVQINQSMSQRGLKYILPVLADAAQVDGTFSVDLDGGHVPLAAPEQGDVSGRLTVNSVQLQAGPLVQELVYVAETFRQLAANKTPRQTGTGLKAAQLKRESTITFRMVDGRVYHRDMELEFDDFTVRTYGSVGLDQSLALMAEMPIPDKWLGSALATATLKGQTLKLPISGTLSTPKVDPKALEQATAQFFRKGAQGVILEGLNQGLERLLGPPR